MLDTPHPQTRSPPKGWHLKCAFSHYRPFGQGWGLLLWLSAVPIHLNQGAGVPTRVNVPPAAHSAKAHRLPQCRRWTGVVALQARVRRASDPNREFEWRANPAVSRFAEWGTGSGPTTPIEALNRPLHRGTCTGAGTPLSATGVPNGLAESLLPSLALSCRTDNKREGHRGSICWYPTLHLHTSSPLCPSPQMAPGCLHSGTPIHPCPRWHGLFH